MDRGGRWADAPQPWRNPGNSNRAFPYTRMLPLGRRPREHGRDDARHHPGNPGCHALRAPGTVDRLRRGRLDGAEEKRRVLLIIQQAGVISSSQTRPATSSTPASWHRRLDVPARHQPHRRPPRRATVTLTDEVDVSRAARRTSARLCGRGIFSQRREGDLGLYSVEKFLNSRHQLHPTRCSNRRRVRAGTRWSRNLTGPSSGGHNDLGVCR